MLNKIYQKILNYFDHTKISLKSLRILFTKPSFIFRIILITILISSILHFFAPGRANLELFLISPFFQKLGILLEKITISINPFSIHMLDWLYTFITAFLQAVNIAMLGLIMKYNKSIASDSAQSIGIVLGLSILGAGCPSCGTSLIMPILVSIFSFSGYAFLGPIIFTIFIFNILVSLAVLNHLAFSYYGIIISNKSKRGKNGK